MTKINPLLYAYCVCCILKCTMGVGFQNAPTFLSLMNAMVVFLCAVAAFFSISRNPVVGHHRLLNNNKKVSIPTLGLIRLSPLDLLKINHGFECWEIRKLSNDGKFVFIFLQSNFKVSFVNKITGILHK